MACPYVYAYTNPCATPKHASSLHTLLTKATGVGGEGMSDGLFAAVFTWQSRSADVALVSCHDDPSPNPRPDLVEMERARVQVVGRARARAGARNRDRV